VVGPDQVPVGPFELYEAHITGDIHGQLGKLAVSAGQAVEGHAGGKDEALGRRQVVVTGVISDAESRAGSQGVVTVLEERLEPVFIIFV